MGEGGHREQKAGFEEKGEFHLPLIITVPPVGVGLPLGNHDRTGVGGQAKAR